MKGDDYCDYDAQSTIMERIKIDENIARLRAEIDSFRQSVQEKEQAFFQQVSANHPWVERLREKIQVLREFETERIGKRRLGLDKDLQEERHFEDQEKRLKHALEGDFHFPSRLSYWKQELNYPDEEIELDPDDEDQDFDFICFSSQKLLGTRKHFTDSDYELKYETDPDNFPNVMRRESFEFWRSLHDKYSQFFVEGEMITSDVDPLTDFEPHKNHFDHDDTSLADAVNWCENTQERLIGNKRNIDRQFARQEYEFRKDQRSMKEQHITREGDKQFHAHANCIEDDVKELFDPNPGSIRRFDDEKDR